MAKRKYKYEIVDMEALERAHPNAVKTEVRKVVNGSIITGLLNGGGVVPGIRLLPPEYAQTDIAEQSQRAAHEQHLAAAAHQGDVHVTPGFFKKPQPEQEG